MPVFIFLFGYNVKYSPKRIVYRWFIPYVIFQCIYILFSRFVLNDNKDFQFTTPYWLLWYMLACIYYQLLLPMFNAVDKRRQICVIICAFILSLLAGYDNTIGYYMSISRFFVFQPWFILGYYCRKNDFLQQFTVMPKKRVLVLLVSMVIIVVLVPFIWSFPSELLYGSYSYSNCGGAMWMRAVAFAMSLSVILFLFVGMKPYLSKKLILITNIGQNTWPIFLLHGFVVKAVPVYFPYLVGSPWMTIFLSYVILLLAGNKLCNKAIYFLCFMWLEKITEKLPFKNP